MSETAFLLQLQRWSKMAAGAGLFFGLVCLAGAIFDWRQFARSWLVAWLFVSGLSFGALAILMLQGLTGGAWGRAIRRLCEAATLVLPWLALLFLPVLFGIRALYPWAGAAASAAQWVHRHTYLNVPFFAVRSFLCFGVLSLLALAIRRGPAEWLPRLSGGGLVLMVLFMNFVSTDWVVSLEPHWKSTIFVIVFMAGQFLSALALVTALAAWWRHTAPLEAALTPKVFHDLGNLLLAFVIFWAYVSFSQYLIIWSGNLPKEISWYLHRRSGGWGALAAWLAGLQFFLPLALLLSRAAKRNPQRLAPIACLILATALGHVYWWVGPAFYPGFRLHWLDFAALLSVGGVWTAIFLRHLGRLPLLPLITRETHD